MIEYALYSLSAKRRGALLRINGRGYADCHPWPELGDAPLETQLALLKTGTTTPLTSQSLYFASLDAEARMRETSLFENLTIPPSHTLIEIGDNAEPYTCIKLKVGFDLQKEIYYLNSLKGSFKVRLDFNERLSEESFHRFYASIAPIHSQIEFIEDPFPYHQDLWSKWRGAPLACDRNLHYALEHKDSFGIAIIKPARFPWQRCWPKGKSIVTSYLDHPLGQLCAAYVAALKSVKEMCGLNSHLAYPLNAYSEQFGIRNDCLIPPVGTGFGFDDLLKNENWKEL